ncbi:MAG: Gfo/Idh/MocA family protein, partial [Nitrospira sp.]
RQQISLNGKTKIRKFPPRDQFAPELVYFSHCILNNTEPEPDGLEGLIDVQIVRALYRSVKSGKPVALRPMEKQQWPNMKQVVRRSPVSKPRLVKVKSPSL